MRRNRVLAGIVVGVVGLLAGGCGMGEWVHPEKPKDQYAQDYRECEMRTYNDPKLQQGSRYMYEESIERCMKKEGWVYKAPE